VSWTKVLVLCVAVLWGAKIVANAIEKSAREGNDHLLNLRRALWSLERRAGMGSADALDGAPTDDKD